MEASKESFLRVFVPGARRLSDLEISQLPEEKRMAAREANSDGVWLDLPCPDPSCLVEAGHITIPVKGAPEKEKKGFFLNLFCPEDTCEVYRPTDLP
jgi:hypothetical protein